MLAVRVPTNNPVLLCCQGLAPFVLPPTFKLEWTISTVNEGARMGMLTAAALCLRAMLTAKIHLAVENLALRQQLAVCRQSVKRPKLRPRDHVFWVLLPRLWPSWRSALAIVQPETVAKWHRKGFKFFWRWKSRAGKPGRPPIERELRDLIRHMSRKNPTWGRIVSEYAQMELRHFDRPSTLSVAVSGWHPA